MAGKPGVTWFDVLVGVAEHVAGAARHGMTVMQYHKQRRDEMSHRLNAALPPHLQRSPAQMAHVLACPVPERHISPGPAVGYPPS